MLDQVREMCLNDKYYPSDLPVADVWAAWERARHGDRDGALPRLRQAVDDLFRAGQVGHCGAATGALVETLLASTADDANTEAAQAIDRLAAAPGDTGLRSRDIQLLRLRAARIRPKR